MARRKKSTGAEQAFASRPAAEGTVVTIVVHDKQRTLAAQSSGAGWAITPTDADEARALERFSDAALKPASASAEETPPATDGDHEIDSDDAGSAGQEEQA